METFPRTFFDLGFNMGPMNILSGLNQLHGSLAARCRLIVDQLLWWVMEGPSVRDLLADILKERHRFVDLLGLLSQSRG
jgi:hypothetical protein